MPCNGLRLNSNRIGRQQRRPRGRLARALFKAPIRSARALNRVQERSAKARKHWAKRLVFEPDLVFRLIPAVLGS